MPYSPGLPFARGATLHGGTASIISSTVENVYLGRRFRVPDTIHDPAAVGRDVTKGLGSDVVLVCVKNTSGSALNSLNSTTTATARGNLVIWEDDVADNLGKCVDAKADSTTQPQPHAGFIDDAYIASVADDDLFYVVCEGPVEVIQGDETTTPALGGKCVSSTDNDTGKVELDNTLTGNLDILDIVGTFSRIASTTTDGSVHRILAHIGRFAF